MITFHSAEGQRECDQADLVLWGRLRWGARYTSGGGRAVGSRRRTRL